MIGLVGRIAAIALAGAAALSPGSAATPSAGSNATSAAGAGCFPAHAHQLARSPAARVYEVGPARSGPLTGDTVYACYLRRGRPLRLGASAGRMRVGPVVLAGAHVAYASTAMGVDTGSTEVVVVNLASGARRSLAAVSPPRRPESFSAVTALVVTGAGSAAWIGSRSGIGQPHATYEVRRFQAATVTVLDSGPTVAPRSLRRRGSTVSWTDAGRTRSAPLH